MHADLHGGSTVVVKNLNAKNVIPSRTLEEAGTMAVCYSNAWDSKVPCRAWWVHHNQVSKTAPSGEYLTVGSFMIRGKKNYLPLSQLVLGFSFFFRLGDDSQVKHADERKVKIVEEEAISGGNTGVDPIQQESDEEREEEEEENSGAFPNTKVNTKMENAQLLKSTDARVRPQKLVKQQKQQEHQQQQTKRIANFVKPQQMPQVKPKSSNRKPNKGKNKKKNDDWTDEEPDSVDHTQLKLLRKLKKGDRLLDLQEHLKRTGVGDEEDDGTDESVAENEEEAVEVVTSTDVQPDEKEEDEEKNEDEEEEEGEYGEEQKKRDQSSSSKAEEEKQEEQAEEEEEEEEEDDEDQSDERKSQEYQKLIASLTGQPLPDDELLYMVPVVSPYTAMQSHKFKVKILPGTSRRGKASKTALHLFTVDKQTTGREKDLFRSVRDQDIARNLPNKIKLVAQNLQAARKSKKK